MAVDPAQLDKSTVDFYNLGLSGESYVPPDQVTTAAPAIDPSLDPSVDQSVTNQAIPDISTVGLDAPTTANPGQFNAGLGSFMPGDLRTHPTFIPMSQLQTGQVP